MSDVLARSGEGLEQSFLMAYEVWWALVLGFAISGVVQAWVPRERIEGALSGDGFGPVAKATGLGAASSSCSYAAIAIAKSLFQKGASAVTALAFQFASTNLVWELGLVLWVLIGLAVRARRVRRRHHPDRADGGAAAPLRLAAAGGAGAPPRAGGAGRPPARRRAGRSGRLARAPHLGRRLGRRRRQLPRRLGRCSGRRSRSASCSPASSACSATTSSTSSSSPTRRRWCGRSRTSSSGR